MSEQPPYGSGPSDGATDPGEPTVVAVVDGHPGRKLNNALTLTLVENGGEPLGKAQQGKGDGTGKKLGILFGFKNYDAGTSVLEYADGSTLVIATKRRDPTELTRGDGTAVATITRTDTTEATAPDGSTIARFVPDRTEAKTDDRYRLLVLDAAGADLGLLDLNRTSPDTWDPSALDLVDGIVNFSWSNFASTDTGGSLPIMFAGTRLRLFRQPTPLEREVLLAASVELGISARCYIKEMGEGAAWA